MQMRTRRRRFLASGACGLLVPAVALANVAATQYVANRNVVVAYQVAPNANVTDAELWVSTDHGRNWVNGMAVWLERPALRYFAPDDGRYDFFVVLKNAAGASSPPPEAGTTPLVTVVVDTIPPLLQVHQARASIEPGGPPQVAMTVSLVEENLGEDAIRVFYQTAEDESWLDGGLAQAAGGTVTWNVPRDVGGTLRLRIIATDRAGNQTTADAKVTLPVSTPGTAQNPDPAADAPASGPPTDVAELPPNERPLKPLVVRSESAAENSAVKLALDANAVPDTPPDVDDRPQLQKLRELGGRFMSEGRYALAAARYRDALDLTPDDPDLLTDLGSALYRLGKYAPAHEHFAAAADLTPNHVAAIEGLALVAATQKRYPEAREHLRTLLKLMPESGKTWLRYGDIEHKLGNTYRAINAWDHVLELPTPDDEVREMARRRLDYFRPGRPAGE